MICPEPDCTGQHRHEGPVAAWCPRTRRRAAELRERWKNAHPGLHYLHQNASHRRTRGTA